MRKREGAWGGVAVGGRELGWGWGREGLGLRKEWWEGHVASGIFAYLVTKRLIT